mmetsp:Transcript_28751/g.62507  ORF Transcript_28751/g.62507 Transcript_28751/m.62507 type:complete len:225 (-) Transcript_28751:15-689(-)
MATPSIQRADKLGWKSGPGRPPRVSVQDPGVPMDLQAKLTAGRARPRHAAEEHQGAGFAPMHRRVIGPGHRAVLRVREEFPFNLILAFRLHLVEFQKSRRQDGSDHEIVTAQDGQGGVPQHGLRVVEAGRGAKPRLWTTSFFDLLPSPQSTVRLQGTQEPGFVVAVAFTSQAAVDHHPLALRLLVPEDPSTAAVGVEGPWRWSFAALSGYQVPLVSLHIQQPGV